VIPPLHKPADSNNKYIKHEDTVLLLQYIILYIFSNILQITSQ